MKPDSILTDELRGTSYLVVGSINGLVAVKIYNPSFQTWNEDLTWYTDDYLRQNCRIEDFIKT